jgi:hypothetical protein
VRLWSTVYDTAHIAQGSSFFNDLKMPASETLWEAPSAAEWQSLSLAPNATQHHMVQSAVESLFSNPHVGQEGLASVCQAVGMLLYTDDVHASPSMDSEELHDHLNLAINNLVLSQTTLLQDDIASMSILAAAYGRLSLHVRIQDAMKAFGRRDFITMRMILREGNLIAASRAGIRGLLPSCNMHWIRISVALVPCGKL